MSFFVYCYTDPRNDVPFYIGKGCGTRDHAHLTPSQLKKQSHMANKLRGMLKADVEPHIHRILDHLTEEEAFRYEVFFIAALGRRGAPSIQVHW